VQPPSEPQWDDAFVPPPPPPPPPQPRAWRHWALLVLTFLTTTLTGTDLFISFSTDLSNTLDLTSPQGQAWVRSLLSTPAPYLQGLWYSLTILAILGAHEMGHYVACQRYEVDASRPYFLPAPFTLTGTLGAFIRIRSRIPTKLALFDIGIAGPIAGFVVAVPALFIGLALSRVVELPHDTSNLIELGEPLLFRAAAWLIWGPVPEGSSINMHPMAFAAWFGLLATALNLFPLGQLDGGHICYAVLGRRATLVTYGMILVAVGLTFVSSSWIVWTLLLVVMTLVFGPRHPPTLDDDTPVPRSRLLLAFLALAMLVLCFTPAPIDQFVGSPGRAESTDVRRADLVGNSILVGR
jgi:membrane-associated protease RseP (regulator of RpoE activity)